MLDINRVSKLLPHRFPFMLVDKIIEMGSNYIVGIKNATANEPFFQGHFPGEPIMPGVLQIEAMSQVGGLMILNMLENPDEYSTYFVKIEKAVFHRKVVPGDTLVLRVELVQPLRHSLAVMKGYGFVGESLAVEATFTGQIIKKN